MRLPPLSALAGFSLILLGISVFTGWLIHEPILVQLAPGFAAMAYPAALGFVIAGIALLVTRPAQASGDTVRQQAGTSAFRRASNGLAGILVLLSAVNLVQWLTGIDFGINQPLLRHWLIDANRYPDRIQPIAAIGFAMTGAVIILLNKAKTVSVLMVAQFLSLAIIFLGLLGIIGHVLGLEDIYTWYSGMALHAGAGFMLCGTGFLSIGFRGERYQPYWHQDDSRKVSLAGATIIAAIGVTGVLGGFAVLYPQALSELQRSLQLSLKNRSDKLQNALEQGWADSFAYANQPLRVDALRKLDLDPHAEAQRSHIQSVASSYRSFGFSGIVFYDSNGRQVARGGYFVKNPALSVAVNTLSPSQLLWKDRLILRTKINIQKNGQTVGSMEAERPLPQLDKEPQDVNNLGKTMDFAVCAPAGRNMHCFPFRSTGGKVLLNLPPQFNGQPIPMSYALAGKTGVVHTKDYRGREVIAAYAPLGALGLGTVLKIDAAELYQPIASKLEQLLATVIILTVVGMALLRLQVLPLVRNMAREINDRKKAETQLNFLAYHDSLTDLPNRLLVKDRMQMAMAHSDRASAKAALLFLDIDNFKTINDTLGHPLGDALLKRVATRLHECVRDTDTVSRQGGDEFLIILTDVRNPDSVTGVLEKIMKRMREPIDINGRELFSSLSIGIAVYPDDGHDFDTLLRKADTAMYHAKEAGRNAYRFYTGQMNRDAVEHLNMRNHLNKALERGEFVLYYQPQIDLAAESVIGAEALIRWNHPELGMVPPMRFIPIAESSGLIVQIGEWVLQEACRQAVAWRQAGLPELVVAVNLSAMQFKHGDLEQSVTQALNESGLPPGFLELELTESILIQDTENVLDTVRRLKSLGVKLSIDDFGTGYSSLAYLKRFAVDKLKIDQSFVRDMVADPNDAAIVQAIIQMARTLHLQTIAEGVEDRHTAVALRGMDCDDAQGYYFAKPMPAEEFSRYLAGATNNQ